jgi:RNA polymerase sigma-70 factor (ECF subfamily)
MAIRPEEGMSAGEGPVDREAAWAAAMRAARAGDAAAYRHLLGEMALVLRGIARRHLVRLGLGPDEAEDVVQEALLALHLKRDSWDETRPILPWVRAIARYKMLDAARRLGRAQRGTVDLPAEAFAELVAAPAPARDMTGLDPANLVAGLPTRERGVVAALALEGHSVAETAARFGIGESAVRVAFHRGLARLAGAAG